MKERELFLAALEIEDPAARLAHLKTECGDDAALLARVESLLASHEGQSQFLNTPVAEQIIEISDAEIAVTSVVGSGSTQEEPDATTLFTPGKSRMTEQPDDAGDKMRIGYLEPSTKPGSLGSLAHYEVLQVIGRGAFGIVLRAFDEKLQRVVAIKVMSPEMASTSPARKRFLREAQASAAIRHEHVVSVYAVEEKPIPYLVMEYIPGLTLQQRLDERGPLDVPTVLRLGRQIAEGLEAAHSQDLIHRDIKPGNILLEAGVLDKVKITDFGLARAADDASLTQSGTIAGTPMYMAPEQALGHKLDRRADLFSLGSVLYQMASGRPPFRAPTALAVLKRVVEETPRPIREIIPETPQWLCDIIAKLHAKNPDDRYQSAQEVADVLADCEVQLKANARLRDFSRIPSSRSASATKWILFTAGGVIGAMLLVGVIMFATKEGTKAKTDAPETSRSGSREASERVATSDDRSFTKTGWPANAPQPAIAPFDVAQARSHQDAWARHLGVPVEYTNSIGMKFRLIPPGEFLMGSTPSEIKESLKAAYPTATHWHDCIRSEGPQHKVFLTQPIYLGIHEVTQAEYQNVMGTNPSHFSPNGPGQPVVAGMETSRHPVERVSSHDAVEFCDKLSQREKLIPRPDVIGYRLPSEAEWEFACRAGTTTKFWTGDDDTALEQAGWFGENSSDRTHAVGELKANPFGLFDVHGNVWEWVQDGWEPGFYRDFAIKPAINPICLSSSETSRIVRGGRWYHDATYCRSAFRLSVAPTDRFEDLGFRVALSVDAVKSGMAADQVRSSKKTEPSKRRFISDEWIDVIPLIDPDTDKWDVPQRTGKNAWRRVGPELVCGGDQRASKLILPLDSDWPAFECELEFTRLTGESGLNVNIPTKVGECPLLIDPTGTKGAFLGSRANGVQWKTEKQLETGKRTTIRFDVRRQQTSDQVTADLNGVSLGKWTGDRNTISHSYREGFPHDRRISLWIHPGGNEFTFHRIRIRMLDGSTAETLRSVLKSAPPAAAQYTDVDIERIAALPAAEQVEEVRNELKKRNPEFDGTLVPTIENEVVTGIEFFSNHVSDISPLRAFPRLSSLICRANGSLVGMVTDLKPLKGMSLVKLILSVNPVSDLSPLKGMPLTDLHVDNSQVADLSPLEGMPLKVLNCSYTKVTNLAPLKGMPLIILWCNNTGIDDLTPVKGMPLEWITIHGTKVNDIAPLKGLPLKQIYLDFDQKRDSEILRSLTTLQKINETPAAEFRKNVD